MKVSELFEESKPDYYNRLEHELKIKRLGSGAFARVFQHPTHPEVVVKIFTDEDHAYQSYLKFCLSNQSNKYIPKILSVHKHVHEPEKKNLSIDELVDNRYTTVFMEKLKPATKAQIKKAIKDLPIELSSYTPSFAELEEEDFEALSKQTTDKDLASFAKFILRVYKNDDHWPDLHNANVMMRGSQLVFTDPTS